MHQGVKISTAGAKDRRNGRMAPEQEPARGDGEPVMASLGCVGTLGSRVALPWIGLLTERERERKAAALVYCPSRPPDAGLCACL